MQLKKNMLIYRIVMYLILLLSIFSCSGSKPNNPIISTGAIAGLICDPDFGGIDRANVQILDHHESWSGSASSRYGQFLMLRVPVGTYQMRGSKLGYHPQEIFDLRVAPDSISIVRFQMMNEALTLFPVPILWIENDSTLLVLDKFIQSGKLFEMHCR